MYDLDTFVERVLLHNNIVTPEQIIEAKALMQEYEGSNMIDGLINAGALDAEKARGIWGDYRKWVGRQKRKEEEEKQNTRSIVSGERARVPAVQAAAASVLPGAAQTLQHAMPQFAPKRSFRRSAAIVIEQGSTRARELNALLRTAREYGASDVHLKPPGVVFFRKSRALTKVGEQLSTEKIEELLLSALSGEQRETLEEHKYIEFSYDIKGDGRYRGVIVRQRIGWEGAFRVLQSTVPDFESLGLPAHIRRLTEFQQGMVLVTGPNGSGKSTSVAAMVELVNRTRYDHIITVEDPIEYAFEPKLCQINQRQVGLHTEGFPHALRGALREDPDVIVIGELRDLETISLAISAAETGHLVFATLDTTSAPRTIDRILNAFPRDEQDQIRRMVSESIRGIICQQLLPRRDGKGQVLALEILFNTPAISNLIRESKLHQVEPLMQTGKRAGMIVMDDYIAGLVQQGFISGEEAYYASSDKTKFQEYAPELV